MPAQAEMARRTGNRGAFARCEVKTRRISRSPFAVRRVEEARRRKTARSNRNLKRRVEDAAVRKKRPVRLKRNMSEGSRTQKDAGRRSPLAQIGV